MSVSRNSNRKVFSFKSVGKTTELTRKLVRDGPELPPVGIKTPVALSETGKNKTNKEIKSIVPVVSSTLKTINESIYDS